MQFAWLPIGTTLQDGASSSRLVDGGRGWQVLETDDGERVLLMLDATAAGTPGWWGQEVAAAAARLSAFPLTFGEVTYQAVLLPAPTPPVTVGSLVLRNPSINAAELTLLLAALDEADQRHHGAWRSALLLPKPGFAVLTEAAGAEDRATILAGILSGGVEDATLSPQGLAATNPNLTPGEVRAALAWLRERVAAKPRPARPASEFRLAGQPRLESELRDRVLDVVHRADAYAALGVTIPNGILLTGPPGAGKSHAAKLLADFLAWPCLELDIASVGSSLLHETPRRIRQVFSQAMEVAPAIVLLEELDGIGRSRDATHPAGAEEVNTLLREVELARQRNILVIGTTNRKSALDPALLRHGRFDIAFEVSYPDAAGVKVLLAQLLRDRPCSPTLDLDAVSARLAGRPVSDAVALVEAAARIAVKAGKVAIDDIAVAAAARTLAGR